MYIYMYIYTSVYIYRVGKKKQDTVCFYTQLYEKMSDFNHICYSNKGCNL